MDRERKVKILHIITRLDPGGSAENTVLSVERIDAARFDSLVITGPGLAGTGPPRKYVKRLGNKLSTLRYLIRSINPLMDLAAVLQIINAIRQIKPDILHLHSAKTGTLGRIAAKLAFSRVKVIYTPHGHVFSGYGGSTASKVFTWVEKRLVPWSDAIVCLTRDEVRSFQAVDAGHIEKFCVIPSGVDLENYYPECESRYSDTNQMNNGLKLRNEMGFSEKTPVIGFIGRLDYIKGPDIFLELAREVRNLKPDAQFVMVGNGEMRDELVKHAKTLGIEASIHFTGWKHNTSSYFHSFDVFVLTSRNEGQGRVLVEAMASERPIVAMKSGGVPEVIIDGESGFLVPAGNIKSASLRIIELLASLELRKEMGSAGRKRAEENFSTNVMITRLKNLYLGLLDGKSPEDIFGDPLSRK